MSSGTNEKAWARLRAVAVDPGDDRSPVLRHVTEGPGYQEFRGFRRWLRDRAKARETRMDTIDPAAMGPTGWAYERGRSDECEAILQAMGDYWLGPETPS